jgi:hypothetical protein
MLHKRIMILFFGGLTKCLPVINSTLFLHNKVQMLAALIGHSYSMLLNIMLLSSVLIPSSQCTKQIPVFRWEMQCLSSHHDYLAEGAKEAIALNVTLKGPGKGPGH